MDKLHLAVANHVAKHPLRFFTKYVRGQTADKHTWEVVKRRRVDNRIRMTVENAATHEKRTFVIIVEAAD